MGDSLLFRIADRAYWRLRGRRLPASVDVNALVALAVTRIVQAIRGQVMGMLYLRRVALHFRERGVRIRGASSLTVGSAVVFGDNVLLDARSDHGISLHDHVTVARGASILGSGVLAEGGVGVVVESGTAIGAYNVIWGQGGVHIGRDCLLGPHVVVVSEDHGFRPDAGPINRQGPRRAPIVVGSDVWVGAGAVITAGVRIGSGAIVGAGAVVTTDVPEMAIFGGVPARQIGSR